MIDPERLRQRQKKRREAARAYYWAHREACLWKRGVRYLREKQERAGAICPEIVIAPYHSLEPSRKDNP